jgi:hypothetical protein
MGTNWFNPNSGQPFDPSTFNYDTAAQKVQRQRAAAQALQALGMQSNQGQFVKSGDFMGYAGGNTVGSSLAQLLSAALSGRANDSADNAQKQLGIDSQNALSWALDPNNSPAAKNAAAAQMQREAEADQQREIDRMNNGAQAGDYVDPQVQGPANIETSPVSVPRLNDIKPMPMWSTASQAVAKALAAPQPMSTASTTGRPIGQPISATGGPQSMGTGANFNMSVAPTTSLPVDAKGPLSADDISFAAKMLGGPTSGNTSAKAQKAPLAYASSSMTSVSPAVVAPAGDASGASVGMAQPTGPLVQPMPTQAATLEDRARAVGIDPTAPRGPSDPSLAQQVQEVEALTKQLASGGQPQVDSRSLVDQARDQGNANASYADKMAALQQIARTGPIGQQVAQGMMQQMFSHADRYDFKMNDNGDAVVFDKWNGQATPVQGMTNTLKVDQADIERRKLVDPSNAQSVAEYNAWRHQRNMPQLSPQAIAGSNMPADARAGAAKGSADSISAITQRRGEAAAQIADLGKINRDLQTGMVLANQAAGKWNGVAGSISQWFGGGTDQQTLNRILNDSMLMSIMQDKGGQGSAGVGLMQAYQQHGMKATMTSQALQQGLQQIQQAIQERLAAKQAEVQAHNYALGTLGYQPQQQPQQTGMGSTSNGRAPGNYSF